MQKHVKEKGHFSKKSSDKRFFLVILLIIVSFLIIIFIPQKPKPDFGYEEAQKLYSLCHTNQTPSKCYLNWFKISSKKLSFAKNISVLTELRRLDQSTNVCHNFAHAISAEAVAKNPHDWTTPLREIDPTDCSSGFIHGAIEGLERINPNFTFNTDFIEKTCLEISQNKSGIKKQRINNTCAHAMGHVLLVEKQADINKALDECPNPSLVFSRQCFNGIFMESIFKTNLNFHGISPLPKFSEQEIQNQEKICSRQIGLRASSCWDIISNLYIDAFMGDYKKAFEYCNHAPEQNLKVLCYTSAVQYLIPRTESGNLKPINKPQDLCEPLLQNSQNYSSCLEKILVAFVENHLDSRVPWFCSQINFNYYQFCNQKYNDISSRYTS